MDFCLGLELTYHLQLDHAQDENPPCSFNEIYYISLSCLVVQSKLPVSCWLENETQCCLQLRSSVFDVHTENVIGALVKCILQPTKDKTVTGKLSCLCLRWWCVVSLKITHLTATIIILFYFFSMPPKFPSEGLVLCHSGDTLSQSESQNCALEPERGLYFQITQWTKSAAIVKWNVGLLTCV